LGQLRNQVSDCVFALGEAGKPIGFRLLEIITRANDKIPGWVAGTVGKAPKAENQGAKIEETVCRLLFFKNANLIICSGTELLQ